MGWGWYGEAVVLAGMLAGWVVVVVSAGAAVWGVMPEALAALMGLLV